MVSDRVVVVVVVIEVFVVLVPVVVATGADEVFFFFFRRVGRRERIGWRGSRTNMRASTRPRTVRSRAKHVANLEKRQEKRIQ